MAGICLRSLTIYCSSTVYIPFLATKEGVQGQKNVNEKIRIPLFQKNNGTEFEEKAKLGVNPVNQDSRQVITHIEINFVWLVHEG